MEMYPQSLLQNEWYDHPSFILLLRNGITMCIVVSVTLLFMLVVSRSPELGILFSVLFFICTVYCQEPRHNNNEREAHPSAPGGDDIYMEYS